MARDGRGKSSGSREGLRAAKGWRSNYTDSMRAVFARRRRGYSNPVTEAELAAIVARSKVKITKLPAGFAFGVTRSILDA